MGSRKTPEWGNIIWGKIEWSGDRPEFPSYQGSSFLSCSLDSNFEKIEAVWSYKGSLSLSLLQGSDYRWIKAGISHLSFSISSQSSYNKIETVYSYEGYFPLDLVLVPSYITPHYTGQLIINLFPSIEGIREKDAYFGPDDNFSINYNVEKDQLVLRDEETNKVIITITSEGNIEVHGNLIQDVSLPFLGEWGA